MNLGQLSMELESPWGEPVKRKGLEGEALKKQQA
jgi:hypothetical protein